MKNHASHQEPGRSQIERKKSIDDNIKMTEMLELFEKDFKETMIKMLQQSIMITLKTNEKKKEISKEI